MQGAEAGIDTVGVESIDCPDASNDDDPKFSPLIVIDLMEALSATLTIELNDTEGAASKPNPKFPPRSHTHKVVRGLGWAR